MSNRIVSQTTRDKSSKSQLGVPKNHKWKGKTAREIFPNEDDYNKFIKKCTDSAKAQNTPEFVINSKLIQRQYYIIDNYIIFGKHGLKFVSKFYNMKSYKFRELFKDSWVKYDYFSNEDILKIKELIKENIYYMVKT